MMYSLVGEYAYVRMAERSKALRSGRSLVLQAWVRIPLLTTFGADWCYLNKKY